MSNCNTTYTWKCLLDGVGVHTYTPTTSTTVDSVCYLVDCNGNYIVDCECNDIVGCPCELDLCSIILIDNNGVLYRYRFDKNLVSVIDSVPTNTNDDVAMTATKLWVNGSAVKTVNEYNINSLDPWSMTFNRSIDLSVAPPFSPTAGAGVGLDAISNTQLITGRGTVIRPICKVDISGPVPVATSFITLPVGRVEGDIYYDNIANKYYISYIDDATTNSYLGIFNSDGSLNTSISTGQAFKAYGIFKYLDVVYVVRADGEIYSMNTTTAALTYVKKIGNLPTGVEITGATSSNICNTQSTTSTTTTASCGVQVRYSGNQGYPITRTVGLLPTSGTVTLNYIAFSAPDRFVVSYNGNIVADSGYVGNPILYSYGGPDRFEIVNSLVGKVDPISGLTYPNTAIPDTSPDGYPNIYPGTGSVSFFKLLSINTATVNVYSPFISSGWRFTLECPSYTSTSTSTSTSTTSTTTTAQPVPYYYVARRCDNLTILGYLYSFNLYLTNGTAYVIAKTSEEGPYYCWQIIGYSAPGEASQAFGDYYDCFDCYENLP